MTDANSKQLEENSPRSPLTRLRRLMRPHLTAPLERCELCGTPLGPEHAHLFEGKARQVHCACDACATLFAHQQSDRFRRVPRRVRVLADFRMSDASWDDLRLPINLAFFVQSTPQGRVVAMYPSPAGATESMLELAAWEGLADDNPAVHEMQPDVEALLANRIGAAREHFIVPIDECYRLVGLIRSKWRGLSGGSELWEAIGGYFERLRRRAGPPANRM